MYLRQIVSSRYYPQLDLVCTNEGQEERRETLSEDAEENALSASLCVPLRLQLPRPSAYALRHVGRELAQRRVVALLAVAVAHGQRLSRRLLPADDGHVGHLHQLCVANLGPHAVQEREVRGWERYMSFPRLRAMIEGSGVENLAQVYTIIKYTRESHQAFSEAVLGYLQEQGFMN